MAVNDIGDTGKVQRIFRRNDLPRITGFSIAWVYQLIGRGEFPAPIQLGERAVGWLESDIAEWQRQRIEERDGAEA